MNEDDEKIIKLFTSLINNSDLKVHYWGTGIITITENSLKSNFTLRFFFNETSNSWCFENCSHIPLSSFLEIFNIIYNNYKLLSIKQSLS